MPTPKVIDLSHHNVIPESLVPTRQSGTWGVIHKLTEGTSYVDSKVDNRCYLVEQAGMLWGVYHYLRHGNISKQVEWFYNQAQTVMRPGMLIAVDYEESDTSLDELRQFMEGAELQFNRSIVIYSGHVLKDKMKGPDDYLNSRRLWLAQYGSTYKLPPGFKTYWLWQYTDQGSVPGVTPPTDLNDYQGGMDQLQAEWSGSAEPAPGPEPAPKPVVRVIAPAGVEVRVEYD